MTIIIIAVAVSTILILILFFALRSTVKRIDYNTKKYFVDKLQDYDYLIEDKKKILDELNKEIEKNKKINEASKNISSNESVHKASKYYKNDSVVKYSDEEIFKKYKKIKQKFNYDYEKIVYDFLNKNSITTDNQLYNLYLSIKLKLNNEIVFKIMNLRINEQKNEINKLLTSEELSIVKEQVMNKKFNIKKFVLYLDMNVEKLDPYIYILTNDKNKKYDNISPNIKTIYDESINEGIKIKYKGKIYDYSL